MNVYDLADVLCELWVEFINWTKSFTINYNVACEIHLSVLRFGVNNNFNLSQDVFYARGGGHSSIML